MRPFYIICSLILLLLTAHISEAYAIDNNSSLLQERSNVKIDVKKDCAEPTTTIATFTSKPTVVAPPSSTNARASCCHHRDSPCCNDDKSSSDSFDPYTIATSTLLFIIGLYLTVYGFPCFRLTVGLTGFIFGAAVSWVSLQATEPTESYPNASALYIGICISVAVIATLICIILYKFGMYLLCGMAAVLLAIYICCWHENFLLQNIFHRTLFTLAIVIFFILGLIFLEFATVITSLATVGTYLIALGVDLYTRSGFLQSMEIILDFNMERNIHSRHHLNTIYLEKRSAPGDYNPDWKTRYLMGAMIATMCLSVVFQAWYNSGKRFGLRVIKNSNDTLSKIK